MLEQPESQIGISDPSLLELKNTKSEKQLAQHIADLEVGLSEFKLDETNAYGATTHEYKNWSWNDILAKMPTEMDATHRTRLEQTESFDDLISYVKNNHIYIIDRYPEYSEHVVKRLLFAREFGWVNLLPEQLGLRQKVRDLLSQEGKIETEPTPQDLKIILKKRQSNLGLSNTELDTLASKLDINTFASLDVAMERPVILTNLIPEIRTTNSYAGYEWEIRPIGGYNYLNLNFIAPDPLLPAQIAKKLAEINWENGTFRLSSMKGRHQNEYSLNFSLTGPSEEWMQKTGRSPYLDYVRRWNGRLEQLFGCAIAVPTKVDSVAGKENLDYEAYCRLLDYTYNDLINRKQLKTKYNTIKFPPMRVDEYYYDYYISEDAKHARDRFLEKLEEILQEYRKS